MDRLAVARGRSEEVEGLPDEDERLGYVAGNEPGLTVEEDGSDFGAVEGSRTLRASATSGALVVTTACDLAAHGPFWRAALVRA